MTAVLSSKSGNTIRRNMALLPAYSLVLGLLALLGFMALAAGVKDMPEFAPYFKAFGPNFAVPALFLHFFPSWFVGVAFAAIGIGALVPAAIMSIAAANLYTRNIHEEFVNRNMTPEQETNVAKLVSLLVKVGAVVFILALPLTYAIQLQLLGGIWIIQTLPALVLGLYTRVLDYRGLLIGWAVGIATGTWMAMSLKLAGSIFTIHLFGYAIPGYAAVWALIVNLVVAIVVSVLVRVIGLQRSRRPHARRRIISTSSKADRAASSRSRSIPRPTVETAGNNARNGSCGRFVFTGAFRAAICGPSFNASRRRHVLDRFPDHDPTAAQRSADAARAGVAVLSLSAREVPARAARRRSRCWRRFALTSGIDIPHGDLVVGDAAGRDRRLAASRQYPQEGGGARGWARCSARRSGCG